MTFRDDTHKRLYNEFLSRLAWVECYQRAACYLMALDTELRKHPEDVFNFEEGNGCIVPEGLRKGWQTGTSMRTTRLMFNLWNGYTGESDEDRDEARLYNVENIFCSEYAPYYYEAVKIRFER